MRNFFRILFLPITVPLDFITKYFKSVVFLTILFIIFYNSSDNTKLSSENLAVVELSGPILDATLFLKSLKDIDTPNIKGVLVVVDSPGGLVPPSIEISLALKELKERKKVVVYSSGTMASGGYYASIWADKIISNPGSIVGSIGVIFEGFNAEELIKKIGIKSQVVKAGEYKEVGSIHREWSELERGHIEKLVERQYEMFLFDVSMARGLDIDDGDAFANGRVFLAQDAKEIGLIDEVGNISYAKNELIVLSGVENPIWVDKQSFKDYFEELFSASLIKAFTNILYIKNY